MMRCDQTILDRDYCRYDSDCDEGMVCEQNVCQKIEYIHPPSLIESDGVSVDQPLGRPYEYVIEETCDVIEEIDIEDDTVVYIMDECGNVYDGDNQLIWGTGQCEMDVVFGEQSSVMVAQPKENEQSIENESLSNSILIRNDSLIEPSLSMPVRYGLITLTVAQLSLSMVLFRRYKRHAD